jgi:hypothetical protein
MAVMTREAMALHAELEAAILTEVEALGVKRFSKASVVRPFLDRCSQATLYRWTNEILAAGKPGQHAIRRAREAADARALVSLDPVTEVLEAVKDRLPAVIRIEDVGAGGTTRGVIARLEHVMSDVEMLVKHAKTADGAVRNARLLLVALTELRRCLETSVRIYQAMKEVDHVDQLHAAILGEIRKESPEVAERILRRMEDIATQWGG